MAKENKKSSLYYKDNKVNLNSFADVLADIYENTKDKENALDQGNTDEDNFRFYQHTKTS